MKKKMTGLFGAYVILASLFWACNVTETSKTDKIDIEL